MSEAPEVAVEADAAFDADFETARLASESEEVAEVEAPEGEDAEAEKPAVDWQKRAMDKEGLAAKERARRREAERQVRDLNERLSALESRTRPATEAEEDDLLAAINALRDDDEDPITDLAQMKRALKAFARQDAKDTEAQTAMAREQQRFQTLSRAMDDAEADFAEDHPDYRDAVAHFKASRREDFEDMGYAGQELQVALANDFLSLVQRAVSGGRDPAEMVYKLAQKRGFATGEKATKDKLTAIAAAAATRTPTTGARGDGALTPDAINRLKGAAYDAAWQKLAAQMKRAG